VCVVTFTFNRILCLHNLLRDELPIALRISLGGKLSKARPYSFCNHILLQIRDNSKSSLSAPKGFVRELGLPDGSKAKEWGPFVYGHSMTIRPDGNPEIIESGNIRMGTGPREPPINIEEEREPLTDIMETDEDMKVVI